MRQFVTKFFKVSYCVTCVPFVHQCTIVAEEEESITASENLIPGTLIVNAPQIVTRILQLLPWLVKHANHSEPFYHGRILQRMDDSKPRRGVQAGRWLVKHEKFRVAHQLHANIYSLSLTTGDTTPPCIAYMCSSSICCDVRNAASEDATYQSRSLEYAQAQAWQGLI